MTLTACDFFCGMGGSSTGLVEAGFEVKVAANHWGRAIETHSANHPDTEHLCADISQVDLRYLPTTDVLWASPICTEISPAGGRARRRQSGAGLFEEYGHVAADAFDRTRVTFWEVIRAAEIHRYPAVLVENVTEAATDWELFPVWWAGMETLGYNLQLVSVSAAHVGDQHNPHAPQWRDRIYVVATRKGIPLPDVAPRPLAWCGRCELNVEAVQGWRPADKSTITYGGQRVGKYGRQYHYYCPECRERVEPWVAPAADAIDWTDLGTRIGDRVRPLAARTMARIRMGAEMIESGAFGFSMAHGGRARPHDLTGEPARTWTTGDTEAMALSPDAARAFVATLRRNGRVHPVSEPLSGFTAGGFHHSLVVPFRKGATPHAVTDPLSTTATRSQHGVMHGNGGVDLDDWHFRMLRPREAANAQRFPRGYIIHGNQGEQQMQAGNAVAVNVAHWLGKQVGDALDGWVAA